MARPQEKELSGYKKQSTQGNHDALHCNIHFCRSLSLRICNRLVSKHIKAFETTDIRDHFVDQSNTITIKSTRAAGHVATHESLESIASCNR